MQTTYFTHIETPIGPLLLAGNESGLALISFPQGSKARDAKPEWREDPAPFGEAASQLRAYFARELREFSLSLLPSGTEFQRSVWRQLQQIPYGTTISYGELACRIGNPKASRAVGLANGANPLPIVIPCHRVIGSNGKLTGFGGGLPIKEQLLGLERSEALLFSR